MSLKVDKVQLDIIINGDESRKELTQLQQKAAEIHKEMKKMKQGTDEYTAASQRLKDVKVKIEEIHKAIGITGMTMRELIQHQKELNFTMSRMNPNLPEYKQLQQELKETSLRMRELKGQSAQHNSAFTKFADGMNKYQTVIMAAVAAFAGIATAVSKAVGAFNDFEKSVANLSALTGLKGDQLKYLSDAAKRLATSTMDSGVRISSSSEEIVQAFRKMGSERPELLQNKEALEAVTVSALVLSEGSMMDLEESIKAVAASMNQFGIDASQSNRIINVLGAGSLLGSSEVGQLTKSLKNCGTVAASANLTFEQTIAALEVLGSRQLKAEQAGTKLKGALMELQKAGVGYKSGMFNLKDALDEVNAQLAAKTSNMEKDALKQKMFGMFNITAGQILLDNIPKYEALAKGVTGTTVAMDQAAIATDTQASKLAQMKNVAEVNAIALGEKLSPAMVYLVGWGSKLIRVLSDVVDWFNRNASTISFLVKCLVLYVATVYSTAAANKLAALWTARFGEAGLFATIQTRLLTIAQNIQFGAANLLAAATMLLSLNLKGAAQAMRVFAATLNATPLGVVVGALTLIGAAFLLFGKKTSEASKAVGKFWSDMATQKTEMNNAFDTLKKMTKGTEEYKKAIEKMNTTYGEYLPFLLTEQTSLKMIAEAQKEANVELERNLTLKASQNAKQAIIEEQTAKQSEAFTNIANVVTDLKGATAGGMITSEMMAEIATLDERLSSGIYDKNDKDAFIMRLLEKYGINKGIDYFAIAKNVQNILDSRKEMRSDLKTTGDFFNAFGKGGKLFKNKTTAWGKGEKDLEEIDTPAPAGDSGKKDKDWWKRLQELLDASRLAMIKTAREHEIAVERAAHATKLQDDVFHASKSAKIIAKQNELRKNLEIETRRKIIEINEKYDKEEFVKSQNILKEKLNLKEQLAVDGSIQELQLIQRIMDIERDVLLSNTLLTQEEIANIEERFRQDKLKAEKEYWNMKIKASDDAFALMLTNENIHTKAEILKAEMQEEFAFDQKLTLLESEKNAKIKNAYDTGQSIAEINAQFAADKQKLEFEYLEDTKQKTLNYVNTTAQIFSNLSQIEINQIDEQKEKEINSLSARGLSQQQYAAEKLKIENKYAAEAKKARIKAAVAERTAAIFEATINGAVGITKSQALMPPFSWINAALVAASTLSQVALITSAPIPQAARGKYPVIGANDGQKYNATISSTQTGEYSSPTILVGEKGPEMVIDWPTYKNIQVNAPHIIDSIYAMRTPQAARGLYPSQNVSSTGSVNSETLQVYKEFNQAINTLVKTGVKGNWYLRDLEEINSKKQTIGNIFNA